MLPVARVADETVLMIVTADDVSLLAWYGVDLLVVDVDVVVVSAAVSGLSVQPAQVS